MAEWLYKHGEISGHDLFIDGTKIESCANRYTFVWKKAVTKSLAKKDISRTENMSYDPEKNLYICAEGKELSFDQIKNVKTKTGYSREVSVYSCKDCKGCPRKSSCIKGNNCKVPLEERNKLHTKIQSGHTGTHLYELKSA